MQCLNSSMVGELGEGGGRLGGGVDGGETGQRGTTPLLERQKVV